MRVSKSLLYLCEGNLNLARYGHISTKLTIPPGLLHKVEPNQVNRVHVSRNHRFHLLDGLRGFAALLVVFYHMPPYVQRWFYFPNSFLAVDFFFCLSGFIIAYSYERRILNGMSLADFSVARLIRLYPLYFLGSTLGLLAALIVTHAYSRNHLTPGQLLTTVLLSLLLLPNLGEVWANHNVFPLNGPAWSLFFELYANLVFWFVIRSRLAGKVWLLGVAGTCLVMLSLYNGPLAEAGAFSHTFTQGFARVGFSFCMGIVVFRFRENGRAAFWSRRMALAVVFLLAGMLLTRGKIAEQHATQLCFVAVVSPLVVYLGSLVKLPAATEPFCSFLGDFSYPLYILHQPFLLIWGGHTAHRFSATHPVATQLSIPVFCFAVAGITWCVGAFYDTPIRARLISLRFRKAVRVSE
jgi:peptidoglycan/LPS O-acetylase OafA/YrhL